MNTIENLKINSDKFIDSGYTVNVIREPSGKTFIELERGQISDEYTNENLYSRLTTNSWPYYDTLYLDIQYNFIENSK